VHSQVRQLLRFGRRYPFRLVKRALSPIEIRRYLSAHQPRLLNIGAQTNRPAGWLNIDIYPAWGSVYLDAADMRALPDASFDAVLCEHMIEHVPKAIGRKIAREIFRILRPTGAARFVTPDIRRFCRMGLDPGEDEKRYVELVSRRLGEPLSEIDAVNLIFYGYGHRHLYSAEELSLLLRESGFSRLVVTTSNACNNALFRDAQGHAQVLGPELNDLEAFGIEAER
jgi:SAM-dependent methyltransferase